MSEEDMANARRVYEEGIAQGNRAVFDELFTEDFVYHDPNWQRPVGNRVDYARKCRHIHASWSDIRLVFDDMFAQGDQVAARGTFDGIWRRGELLGVRATGRRATIAWITIFRFARGKIAEIWDVFDYYGELHQLGVIDRLRNATP
jgi:predicted ester cyclase